LEVGFREGNRGEVGIGFRFIRKASHPEKRLPKDQTGKQNADPSGGRHFRLEKMVTAILHFTKSLERYSDHPDRPG